MKVLITGATGLVGSRLVSLLLEKEIEVHYLTTSKEKIENKHNYSGYYWDPQQGTIDESALIGVDTIVHLAGASIANRWTDSYKQEIIESRVLSANVLFRLLKNNPHQVKQIVSASAIGIYKDSLTEHYTEASTSFDRGFLGNVVSKWENSACHFKSLGIGVCILRTGLVLSEKGGALPEMLKPIKMGVGSALGSGKQIQSWIHLEDLARLYFFAMENNLQSIYNAVAPSPVSNQVLTKSMAKAVDKPLFMPKIPEFLMSLALGEMHQLLFSSQNVSAAKISEEGFKFQFADIQSALKDLL